MKIISIVNQKGGVGKSTTALALGSGLIKKGYRTLFVDLDAQGNLTTALGGDSALPGSFEAVVRGEAVGECIQHTGEGDLIGSSSQLIEADRMLVKVGRDYKLKEALAPLEKEYDYCIVDTPPYIGILIVNALAASSGAVIPAQADSFSLQGISQLDETIAGVRTYINPELAVNGILLTRFNGRSVVRRSVTDALMKAASGFSFEAKLYKTKIRECVALVEAQVVRKNIYDYAPRSNAAKDYLAFVDEFLEDE